MSGDQARCGPRDQRQPGRAGRPTPRGTVAAAARRRRRRPRAKHRRAAAARGSTGTPARRGTGRPWCRSSGARAPGRRRRPRRRARIVVPPKPLSAKDSRAASRICAPGVRAARPATAAPGLDRSPRPHGRRASRSCSRVNASASIRSSSRASRLPALRVLISSTMCPANDAVGEVLEQLGDRLRARGPGSGARPWPSRCRRSGGRAAAGRRAARAISTGSERDDRRVGEVERGVGVVLLRRVPARHVDLHLALAEARQGYMFSTANAMPVRSSSSRDALDERRGRSRAATGTAGARRPRRRRPRAAISALRLELAPGLGAPDPLGDQQAGACTAQTGISWYSERCRTASTSWLTGSMPTITSTAS